MKAYKLHMKYTQAKVVSQMMHYASNLQVYLVECMKCPKIHTSFFFPHYLCTRFVVYVNRDAPNMIYTLNSAATSADFKKLMTAFQHHCLTFA